jgi:hypothetical protein
MHSLRLWVSLVGNQRSESCRKRAPTHPEADARAPIGVGPSERIEIRGHPPYCDSSAPFVTKVAVDDASVAGQAVRPRAPPSARRRPDPGKTIRCAGRSPDF